MKMEWELTHASGLDLYACSCVAHRWDARWALAPDTGEGFVVQMTGKKYWVDRQTPGFFTGLWRSQAGENYAAHFGGRMFTRGAAGGAWQHEQLAHNLYGVWGLADDRVYAWGQTDSKPVMFLYDGKQWSPTPSPPGFVNALHGTAPDLLMAVGEKGMIAHFDGNGWQSMASPTHLSLSSVFVVSADEAYACGPGNNILLEGSIYGWNTVLNHEAPLKAVAKFNGRVYVAAGINGLFKLEDGALKRIKIDLRPVKFDARAVLLMSAGDRIAMTRDGKNYEWSTVDGVKNIADAWDPTFPVS